MFRIPLGMLLLWKSGASSGPPAPTPLHCLPLFHKPSWEQWLPTAAGTAPRSHLAWLHMTCSSKPPELSAPSNLTASQNVQHVPSLWCEESTLLTDHRTVSHHFTNFKLKDNTEKLELHVGSGEVPDGVQGGLWDVNMGLWSRGD